MKWNQLIENESSQTYFKALMDYLSDSQAIIYPKKEDIFKAFELTEFDDVKVRTLTINRDKPWV